VAPPSIKKFALPLSRKKDPALFALIDKLCRSIGSKIPSTLEVDCSVAVTAQYKRGLISFLEDDLTLTMGLPVISEMSTTEFVALLVHEFGQ